MISLKISEIHARDAGKCYARISEKNMSALGIGTWDLVELGGKRKNSRQGNTARRKRL